MKQVDIIIPVHNRPEHTKQSLFSLIENTDERLYNLYIIDDCSDTETAEFIRETYADNLTWVELFRNEINIGPGASRNYVTRKITESGNRSNYLYHTDNDVYFTKGWLEKLIRAYELSCPYQVRLIGGGCHPYLQTKEILPYRDFNVGIKDAVSGYSQLMAWEDWDEFGPFDETMRNAEKKIMGSEDWAFCQKIIKDGYKVGSIEPEVVIATGKTNTYGEPATGHETFKRVEGVMVK